MRRKQKHIVICLAILPGVAIEVAVGTDCKERFRAAVVVEVQDFVEGAHVVIGRLEDLNLNEDQD